MNITGIKVFYTKSKHATVFCKNYKTFDSKIFRTKFENELMKFDINIIEFQTTLLYVLIVLNEKIKQHLRASIPGFITKDM